MEVPADTLGILDIAGFTSMASDIYSTRFLNEYAAATGTYTYLVPAGMVAILRDVDVYYNGGSVGVAVIAEAAATPFWAFKAPTGSNDSGEWRGRQVANAGETIAIIVEFAGACVLASGYLLVA